MTGCKLLNRLVPGAGVEPAPSYEERILSPLRGYLQHSTTRYQVVFTDVSAVKASYVSPGTNTYPPHLPLISEKRIERPDRPNLASPTLDTLRNFLSVPTIRLVMI